MTIKILRAYVICMVLLLQGCSSAPAPEYSVYTYHTLATKIMARGDTKRQLRHYQQALNLYQQAYHYALKRHDNQLMVMAQLKSAAIYLKLNQLNAAKNKLNKAQQINQHEGQQFTQAIDFMTAKLAWAKGDKASAISAINQLIAFYPPQSERQIYYRLVKWQWLPQSIDYQQVSQGINLLEQMRNNSRLQNIEIYSFALLTQLKWLAGLGQEPVESFELALSRALAHFSALELTTNIQDCYQLGVDYFNAQGLRDKAAYYLTQVNEMKALSLSH